LIARRDLEVDDALSTGATDTELIELPPPVADSPGPTPRRVRFLSSELAV